MNSYKTPKEIAAVFGVTEAQARHQMNGNLIALKEMAGKAEKSKNGIYRGFTLAQLQERCGALEAAL